MGHHANNHQQRKDENQCANDSADDGLYRRDAGGVSCQFFRLRTPKKLQKIASATWSGLAFFFGADVLGSIGCVVI